MIVNVVPQFGGSLTIVSYAPRVISYASNIFKVQAIGVGLTDLIDDSLISFQAIIFVIDSSNRERLAESQDELVKLLSEKELRDSCLLILANKQVENFKSALNCCLSVFCNCPTIAEIGKRVLS